MKAWPATSPFPTLAKAIHAPRSRLNDICHGRQAITPAMALRLGRFFQVDSPWFVNMQGVYDLAQAREGLGPALDAIEPWQRPEAA